MKEREKPEDKPVIIIHDVTSVKGGILHSNKEPVQSSEQIGSVGNSSIQSLEPQDHNWKISACDRLQWLIDNCPLDEKKTRFIKGVLKTLKEDIEIDSKQEKKLTFCDKCGELKVKGDQHKCLAVPPSETQEEQERLALEVGQIFISNTTNKAIEMMTRRFNFTRK